MLTLGEVFAAISFTRKAISSLQSSQGRNEFAYPNDHFKMIGASLSNIYFPEKGILSVLRKISQNLEITEIDKKKLIEFNEHEEVINNSIENLVLDYGKTARNSIRQSMIVENIRGRKRTLRSAIQSAINEALTFDKSIDTEAIRNLITEIESLNNSIEETEHELRRFSK